MKRLLCIFIVCLTCLITIAQKNTIYVSIQPVDLGIGLRQDLQLGRIGLYTSASYGNYNFYEGNYIRNHFKEVLGVILYSRVNIDNNRIPLVGCGLTYNQYGERYITTPNFNQKVLNPLSFEISTYLSLVKHLAFSIRFDFIKSESTIDVGYAF